MQHALSQRWHRKNTSDDHLFSECDSMAGNDRGRLIMIFPCIWWRHDIETLSALTGLCDGDGGGGEGWGEGVVGEIRWWPMDCHGNAKRWAPIQIVELAVIWDTMMFKWCHCYEIVAEIRQLEMYTDSKVHGAYMGPTRVPRWASCGPHEHCYLGSHSINLLHFYDNAMASWHASSIIRMVRLL